MKFHEKVCFHQISKNIKFMTFGFCNFPVKEMFICVKIFLVFLAEIDRFLRGRDSSSLIFLVEASLQRVFGRDVSSKICW